MRSNRRVAAGVAALVAALAATVISTGPAVASCDGPVPPFRRFASSAPRVVIGRVTSVDPTAPWRDDEGRSSRFVLHVDYVVRGSAGAEMEIRDAPFLGCADHIVIARTGDVLALAFDVPGLMGPDDPFLATVPAWIKGTPMLGAETISARQVFILLGQTPPPTSTSTATGTTSGSQFPWMVLPACLATCLLTGIAALLVRRQRRDHSPF